MRMPSWPPETVRAAISAARPDASNVVTDGLRAVALGDIALGSVLPQARDKLSGRSVLVAVATQLDAAMVLADLDGWARRIVLLPPDVKPEHLPAIARDAEADAIVCSDPAAFQDTGVASLYTPLRQPLPLAGTSPATQKTEWLLLTSGTTGEPKIAVHTLAGLTGAIAPFTPGPSRPVWATFYDIRRYGGLQIFLRAMLCGAKLVLSRPEEALADHLARLDREGVTHVSGTPTHWRRVLMSNAAGSFSPSYIRLSGEIADQAVLDGLKHAFPNASVGHAYASTEAGVGFDVNDGREGFPLSYLDAPRAGVEMRIVDGVLQIRSARMASGYAGRPDLTLVDKDGWVDTGDMVECRGDRCHFVGRRGGIINVGGLKVHPEEVESVINRHPAVRQSRVKARKSPVLGAIVVADVVLGAEAANDEALKQDIMTLCRSKLPVHKVPALLSFVPHIEMTAGGKVSRRHA